MMITPIQSSFRGYGFVLCVWPTTSFFCGFYKLSSDTKRSRVLRSVLRPLGGIETSTRRSARQAIFLPVCRPPVTLHFRTSTPSQALVMHPPRPLGHRLPSLHHLGQMATLSRHEWNDSKTRQAQTSISRGFLCKLTSLYVFMSTRFIFVLKIFLLENLDYGCFSGSLHHQK